MPLTTTLGGDEMNVALSDVPTLLAESLQHSGEIKFMY
jgi:hypothetical protein